MSVKAILVEALRAVEEAEIPAELRQVAFEKAIELAAGLTLSRADAGGTALQPKAPTPPGERAAESEEPLQRIASKLKLDREVVSHVYNVTPDGKLEIVVSPGRLPSKFGPAMRELALLVASGRQAGGFDTEWTSADEIRQVCEHFKRFDGANFATHLKQMEEVFLVRGTPRKREVKMTMPAWEAAKTLVQRLGPIG